MMKLTILQPKGPRIERIVDLGDEKLQREILSFLGTMARQNWAIMAQSALNSTTADYVSGISGPTLQGNSVYLELAGSFPIALEDGMSAFDMHDTLLRNVQPNSEGVRARAIPFRHSTPGAKGLVGAPMGSQFASSGVVDARNLGKKIYSYAKRLKPGQKLQAGLAPKLKSSHSTDIFSGMQKSGSQGHTQYRTFRTISDSAPDKWQHPGLPGIRLMDRVSESIDGMIDHVITGMLENA